MGSESTSSPTTTGSEPAKPMDGSGQVAKDEITKEASPKSFFVNSEPMREEQVQNAVKFLSHPKVKDSPIIYRRSFLEKKGLTKEEIDEAFRRVPDPAPTVSSIQTANPNQDGQSKLATNLQPQVPAQTQQPAVAAPTGVVSTMTTLRQAQFHWSHAFLLIGVLAVSGAGTALFFKNSVVPRLKSWIRKVISEEEDDSVKKSNSKPSVAEEAAVAAKAAAVATVDLAKVIQEMLKSKNEERQYFEALMKLLDAQADEMKSMRNALRKLESAKEVAISSIKLTEEGKSSSRNGPSNNNNLWRSHLMGQEDPTLSQTVSVQARANGMADFDSGSVRSSSAPTSMEPSVAPHPKSYMEIMAMIQRGEKPPGIKEINDLPPNPNQPPSNPRLAPRIKPWEVAQGQNGSYYGEDLSSKVQESVPISQFNGDSSEPWWQRKNVRITEIEPEDELKMASYRATANERMVQRSWVPPQPPPIVMPEAAAAIRQPKPSILKEQSDHDQMIPCPSDEVDDELQRITKVSESGGVVEINEVSTGPSSSLSEIEAAQE